jgi:hypothetical protein
VLRLAKREPLPDWPVFQADDEICARSVLRPHDAKPSLNASVFRMPSSQRLIACCCGHIGMLNQRLFAMPTSWVSAIELHPSQRLQPSMRYGAGTAHSKRTLSLAAKTDDVVGNTDRSVVAHLNCCRAFSNIMLVAKPCPMHLQISLARFLRRSPSRLTAN